MQLHSPWRAIVIALCWGLLTSCLGAVEQAAEDGHAHDPRDLVWSTDKSGSLLSFSPSFLISDDSFNDASAASAEDLQAFFESTPYDGARSFLADYDIDGIPYSEVLAELAGQYQINPLVILATLQKETGLVSKTRAPSQTLLNKAFGCGCPDGGGCDDSYRGMKAQTECAFALLAKQRDLIATDGQTVSGWQPGEKRRVLDGYSVLAGNRATAVLYTYTPWVLRNRGGNWLFWNVFVKYAQAVEHDTGLSIPFHEGFIGGWCETADDCFYDQAICEDFICTRACTGTCPDRAGPGFVTTRCEAQASGERMCVAPQPEPLEP